MIGSMSISSEKSDNSAQPQHASFILPSQSVLLDADNRQFVWTVKDGKAIRKFVTVDEFSPDGVIVKNGLAVGDSVIVSGMQKVSTGTEVSVSAK